MISLILMGVVIILGVLLLAGALLLLVSLTVPPGDDPWGLY